MKVPGVEFIGNARASLERAAATSPLGRDANILVNRFVANNPAPITRGLESLSKKYLGGDKIYGSALGKVLSGGSVSDAIGDIAANGISKLLTKQMVKHGSSIDKLLRKLGFEVGDDKYNKFGDINDPLLNWEFEVVLPDIGCNWTSCKALPSHYVEDIDIPFETIDVEPMRVNARPLNSIGFIALGEASIKMYGEFTNQSLAYQNAWYGSIVSPAGYYNLPYAKNNTGYKKKVTVIVYHSGIPVLMIQLNGCHPTSREGYGFSSSGNDRIINSMSLSVDRVYIKALDTNEDPGIVAGEGILGKVLNTAGASVSRVLNSRIRGV